jgi:hypothetical protein
MQRNTSSDQNAALRAMYYNSDTRKTFFPKTNLKLENVYVTKKKGNFKEYAYKVGNEYQLAIKRRNTFTINDITLEHLNLFRENKGYKFKAVGKRVVFDDPVPEFEPVLTYPKRAHKEVDSSQILSNENPNKIQKVIKTKTVTLHREEISINPEEIQPSVPLKPKKRRRKENNTGPFDDLFSLITFNANTQRIGVKEILVVDEIKNIQKTKLGGRINEYCFPINGELQIVARGKKVATKLDGKSLEDLIEIKKNKLKHFIYEISGDKITFCKKNGTLPELVPIKEDFLERAIKAARGTFEEAQRLKPIIFQPFKIPSVIHIPYQPAPETLTIDVDGIKEVPIVDDDVLAVMERPKSPSSYPCGFFYPENNIQRDYAEVTLNTNNALVTSNIITSDTNNINEGQNTLPDDDEFIQNLMNMY